MERLLGPDRGIDKIGWHPEMDDEQGLPDTSGKLGHDAEYQVVPMEGSLETLGRLRSLGEVMEEYGAEKYASELAEASRYARERQPDGSIRLIHPDTKEVFSARGVRGGDDSLLPTVHKMLLETFRPEEVNSLESMREMFGPQPDDRGRAIMRVISDESGRVLGFIEGYYTALKNTDGKERNESSLSIGFVVIRPEARSKQLARELYIQILDECDRLSTERGETLAVVAGESVPTVEPVLNKFGRGRVYFDRPDGSLEEVQYFQPPLDWDTKSGGPRQGARPSPEHLMLGLTDGSKDVSIEDVLGSVKAIYEYVGQPADSFENEDAYRRYEASIDGYFGDFKGKISAANRLKLITRKEREALKAQGVEFREHDAADRGGDWKESAAG
jgi:GNAT superfamily N-acetyltransferase